MKSPRCLLSLVLSGLLIVGNPAFFSCFAEAKSARGSGSSRSFSSSSYSSSTKSTWTRNGGGFLGGQKPSSGGYTKPGTERLPAPSGYSKPALPQKPDTAPAPVTTGTGSTSSGYTKPGLKDSTTGVQTPSTNTGSVSSGYSKPGLKDRSPTGSVKPPDASTSSGYSKPGSVGVKPEKFTGGSKFDKQTVVQEQKKKSQESLQQFKAEQSKFKNPEQKIDAAKYESNPLYQKGKVYSGFDYRDHYQTRDNYYRSSGYSPPPYVYNTAPSFGLFDTVFLFWMLNNISKPNVAATAYHHSNDPGFQKWRQEAEAMSKDNAELKTKLAEMDKQIKSMDGTPKDPAYLPKGVPAEVALAASALAEKKPEKPVLRLATGATGGWYSKFGSIFKKSASGLEVELIQTGGSRDNLKLLVEGKADMAVVQSDALAMLEKQHPGSNLVSEQAELYVEYVQLLANRSGNVKSTKDIEAKTNVVYVGPRGSGTALTWEGLCEHDARLRDIPVKYADYASALLEVVKNPNALMMFVGGLNSDFLKKAEQEAKRTGKLRLVEIPDRHLEQSLDSNGNRIYKFVAIPSNIYPNLQKGWFFSGDVETLAVQAVLVLRTEWVEKFGSSAMDALSLAVMEAKPDIQHMVNGASTKVRSSGHPSERSVGVISAR